MAVYELEVLTGNITTDCSDQVALVLLYVAIQYMFVSQSSQVLALLGVFLEVGIRGRVPASLMAFSLFFASS